jgi:hypothetical protein
LVHEHDLSFSSLASLEQPRKIVIEKGYLANTVELHTQQYLDFVLIKSKALDLTALPLTSTNTPFLLYSNAYYKKFPNKYLAEFVGGHSYYLGKYNHDYDAYIVFEPLFECDCEPNSILDQEIAQLIKVQVINESLKRYHRLT